MSRSKLSMLSSSTVHLDLDEGTTGAEDQESKDSMEEEDPSNWPHPHNSYENTVEQSSFREELISHFERRLSDLGPRSKYPYLQQIDQQHSAVAMESLETTSQSEEMLTQLPKKMGRGTWWKYYAGLRVARGKGNTATQDSNRGQSENNELTNP